MPWQLVTGEASESHMEEQHVCVLEDVYLACVYTWELWQTSWYDGYTRCWLQHDLFADPSTVLPTLYSKAAAMAVKLAVPLATNSGRRPKLPRCRAAKKAGIKLVDRQLACMPISSPEGQDYLKAMAAAANFAFCNRKVAEVGCLFLSGEAGLHQESLYPLDALD